MKTYNNQRRSEMRFFKKQERVFWLLWITYAVFYIGRVNLAVAIPGMMDEFGWSKVDVGIIGTALFWAYAVGQFVNGFLGDKLGSKIMVTIGLVCSALANFFFQTSTALIVCTVIWAVNGYFQACGWGPVVRVLAHWFPSTQRGRMSGKLGTSYILGSAASGLLAGFVYSITHDWHAVFIVPAGVLLAFAVNWFARIKVSPTDAGYIGILEDSDAEKCEAFPLSAVYGNWKVWLVGLALFCANILRYGFLGWAVTYFFEVQGAAISTSAYKSVVFPVAGAVGAILAGRLSDKIKHNRALVASIFLALAGVGSIVFPMTGNWVVGLGVLAFIGFSVFGAHPLLCAAAPMDFSTKKAVSAAVGFIDAIGYVGAGLTAVGTGFLVDNWGWNAGFAFWIIAAFVGAGLMGVLSLASKRSVSA